MQLTSRAKQIIDIASAESKNTGSQIISSTHLLLGILKQENSIAANVLMQLSVDVDKVLAKAEDIRETERSNSIPNPFRGTPIMRPQIVSILEDIVKEYGVAVYKDRERCENLLWERRGDYSREVVALQLILKIGIVDDLASSIHSSNFNTLTMSAINKATDLLPIDNGCAIQAIMAWVKA